MFRVDLNDFKRTNRDEYEFSSAGYDFPWLLDNKECASMGLIAGDQKR